MTTRHRVKQGECLSSHTRKYGFTDWRTVSNHPENPESKRKHPNPYVMYRGNQLFILDRELR